MSRLLVTGGAGFIGANFVHYWLGQYPSDRIVVLDALTYAGNLANLDPLVEREQIRFVAGDIRDYALVQALLAEERIDTIVHFAAESHVDRSISGPDAFIDTNIVGTHALLKAAREAWKPEFSGSRRFHHVSTDEVYGSLGADEPAFAETTPYAPNSPYAASKASSDHLVRAYHETYGLPVSITNCSNNYGAYQFPEKLIPLMIVNVLLGRELPVYGDGLNIRDWLYVEDHSRGIDRVMRSGRVGETYNIGGREERANIDIVHRLCAVADERFRRSPELRERFPGSPASQGEPSAALITFVRDRPGHDRRYAIDPRKIEQELGFHPSDTFESGLEKTVDWYLNHEVWWRELLGADYQSWIRQQYSD